VPCGACSFNCQTVARSPPGAQRSTGQGLHLARRSWITLRSIQGTIPLQVFCPRPLDRTKSPRYIVLILCPAGAHSRRLAPGGERRPSYWPSCGAPGRRRSGSVNPGAGTPRQCVPWRRSVNPPPWGACAKAPRRLPGAPSPFRKGRERKKGIPAMPAPDKEQGRRSVGYFFKSAATSAGGRGSACRSLRTPRNAPAPVASRYAGRGSAARTDCSRRSRWRRRHDRRCPSPVSPSA
jgi:hypothetical protein